MHYLEIFISGYKRDDKTSWYHKPVPILIMLESSIIIIYNYEQIIIMYFAFKTQLLRTEW